MENHESEIRLSDMNCNKMLSEILNSIDEGIIAINMDAHIVLINKAAQRALDYEEKEALGQPYEKIFRVQSDKENECSGQLIKRVLQDHVFASLLKGTMVADKRGCLIPVSGNISPIADPNGNPLGATVCFRDMRQEKEQMERIEHMIYHDALTGLYNRRYVMDEIGRLTSAKHLPLALVIGDVNGLKMTNDAFGHEKGDMLLKKAAAILNACCRKTDVVVRWGGDEFLIFMPETDAETARRIIQDIKKSASMKSTKTLPISVSFGYAIKKDKSEPWLSILNEAEKWMYHKKLLDGKSYRNNIIKTLLATLNERSIETEEHSRRIEKYCLAMGTKLELNTDELSELTLLAMLHDIGKIGIDQQILKKPGRLTQEEWQEIRRHPEIGYRIVKGIPELSMVAEYVLLHHERWDGNGYPSGYKGEQIPLLCRILAVADAYDVMISGRVYQPAYTREESIAELLRNAGTQFDPVIVKLFIQILSSIS